MKFVVLLFASKVVETLGGEAPMLSTLEVAAGLLRFGGAKATACAGEAAQEVNDAAALIYVVAEATTHKAKAYTIYLRGAA